MSFPYVHVSFPSTKEAIGVEKEGCSTCVVYAAAHYDWFKGMKDADTQLVTDLILRRVFKVLFKTFPQLEDKVVFAHLATPLSHEFHLGSKRGSLPFVVAGEKNKKLMYYLLRRCTVWVGTHAHSNAIAMAG